MRRLPVPNIYGNLFSVAQKVVAITGAGQGIGLALAEGFAAAGANVVLVDLNAETLAQARTKVEKISKHVTSVMTDVSADGAPAKIVAASKALGGRVDCLINNAGIMSYTDSRTITDDDRMIKINLKAPIRIMKAVLYEMESQGSGSIINIGSSWSSRASVFNQSGGGVDYCSAKAALQAYTRGAAQNVAEKRIRVNAIAPGGVDTPMHAHHRDFLMEYEKYIPLGRMTVAEDLVGTAIFLASEASASAFRVPMKSPSFSADQRKASPAACR